MRRLKMKKRILLPMPPVMHDELELHAAVRGVAVTALIRTAVERYLRELRFVAGVGVDPQQSVRVDRGRKLDPKRLIQAARETAKLAVSEFEAIPSRSRPGSR